MSSAASPFAAFLAENYAQFKVLVASGSGRRTVKLMMVSNFWNIPKAEKERLAQLAADPTGQEIFEFAMKEIDDVPIGTNDFEEEISDMVYPNVMGIVIRADYSNDEAWASFMEGILDAERDLMSPVGESNGGETSTSGPSTSATSGSSTEQESQDDGSDSSSSSDSDTESSFVFLDPPVASPLRRTLSGISNLAALRLLNDVDVAKAPTPPTTSSSISLQHRLVNLDGFIERYYGPLIWIYDHRSNSDRAARVVSQCAESVEAATADSWRAKTSFLPELQLHLSSGTLKIDFGGLDRWDQTERQRNMAEANELPTTLA